VRHGKDDHVAGRGSAECPGRGPAAERGEDLGLGRVAAVSSTAMPPATA